ncbi:MAG: hypothetical protein WBD40_13885 [Tepidisphaeraceae bacterium]
MPNSFSSDAIRLQPQPLSAHQCSAMAHVRILSASFGRMTVCEPGWRIEVPRFISTSVPSFITRKRANPYGGWPPVQRPFLARFAWVWSTRTASLLRYSPLSM